jgi:CheY-like chemotaxis protein
VLANAVKYTPAGGTIRVRAFPDGHDAVLQVTDSGMGIPRELLGEVFQMFAQVNRTLDRAQGGLGIGLALAQRLVGLHGGTITAESPGLGQGSTFTVRLQRLDADAQPATGADPAADGNRSLASHGAGSSPLPPLRILAVDDNQDAAESLALLLGLGGHVTQVVVNGDEALAAAQSFRPDVAFLDLGLGGVNGLDLARAFRADPVLTRVYLVALTGWGRADDRARSKDAGFDVHLTKPIDAQTLDQTLSGAVQRQLSQTPAQQPANALRANRTS